MPPASPSGRTTIAFPLVFIALVLLAAAGSALYAKRKSLDEIASLTASDPSRAPKLIRANGCAGCHTIPGIVGAHGVVGPDLDQIAKQTYIGGVLSNTPDNLALWIRAARDVDPNTAMPSTRISEQDSRDIAAYLYSR